MNSLVSLHLRRNFKDANSSVARGFFQFNYPHSFQGLNNALNNRPQKDQYPS